MAERDDDHGRGALYYPHIRVPPDPWFTPVLLYWDFAGAIVPQALHDDSNELGIRGRELNRANLLKLISPDAYTPERDDFGRDFVQLLEQDGGFVAKRQTALARGAHERLHAAKADQQFFKELEGYGLAREGSGDWWDVESQTAELYMAGLASVLGNCQPVRMDPVCDRRESLDVFTLARQLPPEIAPRLFSDDYKARKDEFRVEIVSVLLPAPVDEVPVAELVSFKDDYGKLLPDFRARVESQVIEVAREPDPGVRADRASNIRDQLLGELEEVEARMRERRWKTDPIGSALHIAAPVTGAAISAATGSLIALPISGPYLALALWRASQRDGETHEGHPLAYAAKARKTFN